MAYTTIDDPTAYFQTKIYTGNGSTQTISGVGFQPDWTWIKHRDGETAHMIFDSVRGALYRLQSNSGNTSVSAANTLTSWNSDGFVLGTENDTNGSSRLFASWNWKAGTAFTNDASATSVGSIDSSGSVNTDAGFSIVSYTGTGANATIAHGLSAKPQVIFTKSRDTSQNWLVQHKYSIGSDGWTDSLVLNLTNSADDDASYWNDTEPTSTVFSVGSSALSNKSSDAMIAYCFAEKQGYSKFGSYTGNGNADGVFIYTGFKPAWIMTKRTDSADDWQICDNKRDTDNAVFGQLNANSNAVENTSDAKVDFLSNGFKIRKAGGSWNASGGSYIYLAFAENPFVTSGGVPATAR